MHRNPSKFWEVLLRQNINFWESDISIIWAGEQGADGGGLYKEFLLHSMENFPLTNQVFGRSQSLLFTAIPEAVMHEKYHTLGQLSTLAILTIGRGPSCLNKLLVHTLFDVPDYSLMLPEEDLDGELGHYLKRIEEGDVSALVDAKIEPSKDLNRNKEMFINFYCIISRAAAIEQFRNGVNSISREIIERKCCFKSFFVYERPIIKLKDLRKFLSIYPISRKRHSCIRSRGPSCY